MNLSQEDRFNFYKKIGIKFNKVLDIGAYEGHWKDMFKSILSYLYYTYTVI